MVYCNPYITEEYNNLLSNLTNQPSFFRGSNVGETVGRRPTPPVGHDLLWPGCG